MKPKDCGSLSKYMTVIGIDWNTDICKPKVKNADIVVSFSLGAAFALEYASKYKVKKLILCSATPFETLKGIKADEIILITGEKEKFLIQNYRRLMKLRKCQLIIVPKTDHRLTREYVKTIVSYL